MENRGSEKLTFGRYFQYLRKQRRVTLRAFCKTAQADPGNISRLERGVMPPPQSADILEQYAGALGINKGSDEWYQFFDLAAAEQGRVPQDILNDEELVKSLPMFFRTLRGERPTEDEMRGVAEKIRRQLSGA